MNRRLAERPESKIDETVNMGMQVLKEYSADDDRLMTLSVGPQHPGSGHFDLRLRLMVTISFTAIPDPGVRP